MGRAFMHGWVSLPTRGEVYLEHGVPREARIEAGDMAGVDDERLVSEIEDVTGLHVSLDHWEPVEEAGETQAAVHVDAGDIGEVMRRLALATAETFYDRYHKTIDAHDTDFDDEAYAQDFNVALDVCGLHWGQVDMETLRAAYRSALHGAAKEIARH